jgi:hypothetical protein
MPDSIKKIPPTVWLLGLVWCALGAFGPAAAVVLAWLAGMTAKPDWPTLWHQSVPTAAVAAIAYWQKYKADVRLPAWAQEAMDLAHDVKRTEATQVITQPGAAPITIRTVATETRPTEPQANPPVPR